MNYICDIDESHCIGPRTALCSSSASTCSSRKLSDESNGSSGRFASPVPSETNSYGRGSDLSSGHKRSVSCRHSSSSSDSSFQCETVGGRESPDEVDNIRRRSGGKIISCQIYSDKSPEYIPDSLSNLLKQTTLTAQPTPDVFHSSPVKPVLKKSNAVEIVETEVRKKMERGISHATGNETLVSAARTVVQLDFSSRGEGEERGFVSPTPSELETPIYTFTLPNLTRFPQDFRGFLEKDLIELSALISLEQGGRLNWWADTGTCQRLWPLATTGDGNCLLHAASLGMWGFHDRLLTLRKALYSFLTLNPSVDSIYRRWRLEATIQNRQSGLYLTEAEWDEEWNSVLRLASPQPRIPAGQPSRRRSRLSTVSEDGWENPLYESLEEIHILVLAHVIRRPIIIVADLILKDAYGEALAPIPFGGIYLPLEIPPSECHKCPLILTYDSGHFSALVSMQPDANSEFSLPAVIPVTDSNHVLLPLQFSIDPGSQFNWAEDQENPALLSRLVLRESEKLCLLREYLDLVQVPLPACFLDPAPSPDLDSPEYAEYNLYEDQDHKSRTSKQIQSVAKQFGSLGKTVSKKLKKNLGTITRLARTGSFKGMRKEMRRVSQTTRLPGTRIVGGNQDHILAALIETQHSLPYQQEMVENYLQEAKFRFTKDKEMKLQQAEERREREKGREPVKSVQCVNPSCRDIGHSDTSYLCRSCYSLQVSDEFDGRSSAKSLQQTGLSGATSRVPGLHGDGALYGSGKSTFYVNPDSGSYQTSTESIPRVVDPSIYLANSTFYRDRVPDLVVPVPKNHVDPMPIVPVSQLRSSTPDLGPKPPIRKKPILPMSPLFLPRKNIPENTMLNANLQIKLPPTGNPCRTQDCKFFGSPETSSYCSKCFKEQRSILD
ncbi:OTU domain-containing protein 7B isoform X2 [Eurytemora carolleeae]|uniref:OTU domain-containing protein 7B isoform X2 n=1 Tax=Eurytemora carolleeae TaxID=1294199 RepID=UPI000C760769|nr:OTU domain-containing protein 7B isoform X2 [Eurytemora carolleeae]|eukprot:XP_023330681.1 OTU domain-containing protein 7B-like isoform X2 [Eurytemora affinis]